MKQLMSIKEYIHTNFTKGSRPCVRTVKSWIDKKIIPGKKIGNTYYVEAE